MSKMSIICGTIQYCYLSVRDIQHINFSLSLAAGRLIVEGR